jgi:hypothetical protein
MLNFKWPKANGSFLFIALLGLCKLSFSKDPKFRVIAFYTGKHDLAHISFIKEANQWFTFTAKKNHFIYDTTSNWNNLNQEFLKAYQIVIFLDTRPEKPEQRLALQQYVENGGGWIGFHFSAFALTPSAYPQNWDWYHEQFLGSGSYKSNTWKPTAAILKVERKKHPVMKKMPASFKSSPNEWYRWEHDLRKNPEIEILAAVDSASFPLGTGPKAHEIWHSGYYPVVWSNKRYKMVYFNMGHNDMDYDTSTNETLSFTFAHKDQNRMILNALLWLGKAKK